MVNADPPPDITAASASAASTYIVIPAHNRRQITIGCLNNLSSLGILDRCRAVVIDDGSTDGTAEALSTLFPEVSLIRGDGSLWWTGAIRKGMEFAIGSGALTIVWLNDDCRIRKGTIERLIEFVTSHPRSIIGAQATQGGVIVFGGKRRTWRGFRWLHVPDGAIERCDLVSGNLVCFPRSVVHAAGYPDVQSTPHYGGDSLYLIRCRNAGFSLFVDAGTGAQDVGGKSNLMPESWIRIPGGPFALIRLAMNPRSGLSWRVWWKLNREAYGAWGVALFLKKYLAVAAITAIRLLAPRLRKQVAENRG
jgi:GT2 family glycosyltransferase